MYSCEQQQKVWP